MNTTPVSCFDAPPLPLPCGAPKRALAHAIDQLTGGYRVDAPLDHSFTNQAPVSFRDMDGKQIAKLIDDQAKARAQEPDLVLQWMQEQLRVWEVTFEAMNTPERPYLAYAADMAERKQLATVELEATIADAEANGTSAEHLELELQCVKGECNAWRRVLRKRGLHGDETASIGEQFQHCIWMQVLYQHSPV
ncbi:hypothetical protein [Arenimonas sp. MALMAid1274]|uniref:hypothetical protein n=1 Tax=Arenimonas sp. MALMAid1274 TaxID=3411630 RepID=UPI003BA0312D